jgi:hypothetical protein
MQLFAYIALISAGFGVLELEPGRDNLPQRIKYDVWAKLLPTNAIFNATTAL